MLSTFLSQLQSYFSKYFVIGNFFPVLAFVCINGIVAYFLISPWRAWVDANILDASAGRSVYFITGITVGTVLLAYILSSLSTFLRRLLEGRGWEPVSKRFIPTQNRRRTKLVDELAVASKDIIDLRDADEWEKHLRDAREAGRSKRTKLTMSDPTVGEFDSLLHNLEIRRSKDETIPAPEFQNCVNKLEELLEKYDVDQGEGLDDRQTKLIDLIAYANERAYARHARLQNELNSNFGAQEVSPTKMGNVANTIQSYALRRYHCNLELIWSNLQRVVQKDEKAQAALQEAKTQLDFLVACCWLTLLSVLFWAVFLSVIEPTPRGFLIVAIGGPALCYMWYRAAAEQYRSFADVAMTTLDAFRFQLLEDLQLGLPADVEDERIVWESLDKLATYGEAENFQYKLPKHGGTT